MKRLVVAAVALLSAVALSIIVPTLAASGSNTGTTGNTGAAASFPACTVAITTNPSGTEATATVISGCLGGGFQFTSWIGIKTQGNPADLFDRTTIPNENAAYVVKLPPCVWQVDFVHVNTDGSKHLYKFLTGGTGTCTTPTTTTTTAPPSPTTTTTTTTPAPTTTTTTIPQRPIIGLPPAVQPVTTTTTLPQITHEQQQVNISPGVTQGNG